MKKLFSLCLAVLASVSLWADEVKLVSVGTEAITNQNSESAPTYLNAIYNSGDESYSIAISTNFSTAQSSEYKPDGITKTKDYYYSINNACDMSTSGESFTNYIRVAATNCKISKIVLRAICTNSTTQPLPAVAFIDGISEISTLNKKNGRIVDYIISDQSGKYSSSKLFSDAATLTYNFTTNVSEVYLSKQIKQVALSGDASFSNIPSSSQTSGIFGIDVYVVPNAPAASYTITYDANGGSGEMENSTNTVSANGFTYEGKDFVEWNTQADGEGTSYAPGATATSDLNLFAIWQDHVAKYTLVYKVDGDSVNSEIVTVGGTPAGITAPTKDCYTFAGWNPALDAVSGTDGATVYVNATWTPVYSSSATLISEENVTAKTNVNTIFAAANIVSSITFTSGNYEFTSNETKKGYYGYKDKQSGDNFKILLEQGKQVQVLFGNLGADPTIKINGTNGTLDAALATGDNAENTFTYHASEEDALISITLGSGTNTLKKIDIAEYVVSDDATIKSLTVNGEAVEAVEDVYSYIVGSTSEATKVAVVFVLNDAKASADKESGFEIDVPEAGAAANTATITVTAEDETQKVYTVSVTKATAASDDATLKALSVAGLTLAPEFDPEVTAYTVTKAYEAAMPAVGDVTATANDANAASVDIVLAENIFTITVTAEDGETKASYTITVNNAPAIKSLKEVLFSNGFNAFIDNTNRTVKAFYLSGSEAPTAITITAGTNCTASEIVENVITVTGADESEVDYTVTLEAVTPYTTTVAESAAAGAFDGTEAWVKNGLLVYGNSAGWVANDKFYVLRRQIKNGDAADDQRVIAGWVRTYFFVGNASKLQLTIANNNKVKYSIDGGTPVASESNTLVIPLESGNHMIEIVTNQNGGDCRISAPKLVERPYDPTALYNTEAGAKAQKRIENGQLVIERDGKTYNAQGQIVR